MLNICVPYFQCDLKVMSDAKGGTYYRDHLPLLGMVTLLTYSPPPPPSLDSSILPRGPVKIILYNFICIGWLYSISCTLAGPSVIQVETEVCRQIASTCMVKSNWMHFFHMKCWSVPRIRL